MQPLHSYIQTQAIICAIINMIVNPMMSWLGNRDMQPTALAGIVIDMTITCLIMSTVITYFTASGVDKGLKTGTFTGDDEAPRSGVLSRLPESWWAFGLALGFGFAIVLVPLTLVLFTLLGLQELPFWALVAVKVIYTGGMAYVVTKWMILRRLHAARQHQLAPLTH